MNKNLVAKRPPPVTCHALFGARVGVSNSTPILLEL